MGIRMNICIITSKRS